MKKFLLVVFVALLFMPMVASAAQLRVNNQNGNEVMSSGEKVKNAYAFGNNVLVQTDVLGDFVGAGNYVAVNGNVQYSLMAAAANVVVNGDIRQNARLAGGTVQVNGSVGEDLLAAAGTLLQIADKSKIGGDLAAAAGAINVYGDVGGYTKLSGGQILLDGVMAGNVDIRQCDQLTIGDNAIIHGNITYTSAKEAVVSSKAKITGDIKYTKSTAGNKSAKYFAALFTVGKLISLVSLYVLVLLLTYLLSRVAKLAVERGLSRSAAMFGWGIVTLIVVPVVAMILLASILGIQASVVLGSAYFLLMMVARSLGALMLGAALFRLFNKTKKDYRVDWLSGLIGVVVATVLMAIPFIGWIIPFAFFMIALGVVVKWSWDWAARNR